jgi:hypothetical protein
LVVDAEQQADGDMDLAIALLRDRLIGDASFVAERADFINWLAQMANMPRPLHRA